MKNFRIIDGAIYAGSAPSIKDLEHLKNILNIKTVVSLDQNEATKLAPILKSLSIEHVVIPLDTKTYLDKYLKYIINYIDQLLKNSQPVFVHCLHGQDRTGFVEAVFHLKNGKSLQTTLNKVKQFGFGNGVPQKTKNFWINILTLLDSNKDVSMLEDQVISNLRDTFRIDEMQVPQGYQRGWLGPSDTNPTTGNGRIEKIKNIFNGKLPEIGVYRGEGPMRGLGPVEHSGIGEFN